MSHVPSPRLCLFFFSRGRLVKDWAYARPGHYANYIKPHLGHTEGAVTTMEGLLPAHNNTLDPKDVEVVRAQPHVSVRKASTPLPSCIFRGGGVGFRDDCVPDGVRDIIMFLSPLPYPLYLSNPLRYEMCLQFSTRNRRTRAQRMHAK